MRRREDIAQALAYADDCLEPKAAAEFEQRLESDPELKRQVGVWRNQNVAIRKAFETRRITGASASAARAAANVNRAATAGAPANVARFPARPLALAPRPARAQARGHFLRLFGVIALAGLILAASAAWRPNRAEAFRAEAESAWRAYRSADMRPPLLEGQFDGPPSLAAIMTAAWFVPASPAPARFAFDTRDGRPYGVLVGESDGIPAFPPFLDARSGPASAVWSDGRRLIALIGEGGDAEVLAEARRLWRP